MLYTDEHTWTIQEIEALTEQEAQTLALETMTIKEHTIYFVDFKGYFGYSCLVFADGHHIHYANDYELHHKGLTHDELKNEWYIPGLNKKLFTDEEIRGPIHTYNEFTAKQRYLMSYYPKRRNYISNYFIGSEEERSAIKEKIKTWIFSPLAMAFFPPEEKPFVDHMHDLHKALLRQRLEAEKDPEYLRAAFLHEMYNHEYEYNWQGNYDVLSCFYKIHYVENDSYYTYFKQANLSQMEQKAYIEALHQYRKEMDEREAG